MTQPDSSTQCYIDDQNREFYYRYIDRPGSDKLLIHFSAFFGDWGDRKEYKDTYQGYFHRLKMLGGEEDYSALFLCDQFGVTKNGTYYLGEKGDFFVERAMYRIINMIVESRKFKPEKIVMAGSSMGATAALKFGLAFQVKGIVAISPHIDLDICAAKQGRELHVEFILKDGDPYSPKNFDITRQIRMLIARVRSLPALYIHTCKDDYGVYEEQVLPLQEAWEKRGGSCYLDVRETGGHTSDYCHKAVLTDVIKCLFAGESVKPLKYHSFRYLPAHEKTLKFQVKKHLKRIKLFLKSIF